MTKEIYTFEEIAEVLRNLTKKYRADNAMIFGSYARNEAVASSDIDVVVFGGPDFDPTDIFCIADELYAAMGKNVDVYEIREIKQESPLHRSVMKEGRWIA